jgi:hypothetical protein
VGLGEEDDGSAEDLQLPNPDEILVPLSRKKSANNLSPPPSVRTRQRHVLTEEDMHRMARLR